MHIPAQSSFPSTFTFPLSPNSWAGVTRLIARRYLRDSGSSSTPTHMTCDFVFLTDTYFL